MQPHCMKTSRVILLASLVVTAVQGFYGRGIFSSPSIVQEQRVQVEFYAVPEEPVPENGEIKLTAPDEINVYSDRNIACFDPINNVDCSVSVNDKTFTITTKVRLQTGRQFQFQLTNAIDNPDSTLPTNSWQLLTSMGESLDEEMHLTATQGQVNSFTINPDSNVVGASTDALLRWRSSHSVPTGSFFKITFPKWNANNPIVIGRKSFVQGAVSCTSDKLSNRLQCVYQDDTLIISGGVSSRMNSQEEVSVRIYGFRNPIDTGLYTGFTVTSMIKEDGVFYPIDTGVGSLQVSEYASVFQGHLEVEDPQKETAGMIQQSDDMKLTFYLPVPLDEGCQLTVVLPSQYSTDLIKQVSSANMFGRYRTYRDGARNTLEINEEENSFTIYPCDSYKENDDMGVLTINELMQYRFEKETDSLQIRIHNSKGDKIAFVDSGITFTPIRGAMTAAATASNSVIQTATSVTFTLRPEHNVFKDDSTELQVRYPDGVIVSFCSIDILSEPKPENPTCKWDSQSRQLITIKDFMTFDYVPGGDPIVLTVGEIINPKTTKPVDSFSIIILAGDSPIDEYYGITNWPLTVGTMVDVFVNPGGRYVAYTLNLDYEFVFTPKHDIPVDGYIDISIPNEIQVPDTSYTTSSCNAPKQDGISSEAVIICQLENYSDNVDGRYKLRISHAFRRQEGKKNRQYKITLPGVQNPIMTKPTKSFLFETFSSDDYGIDAFEGANIEMLVSAEISSIELSASNYVNSMKVTYEFTMMPSVPVNRGNEILVTFPPQIRLPDSSNEVQCQSSYSNLLRNVWCEILEETDKIDVENTVIIHFELAVDVINEQDRLGFSIQGVFNPPSTQTTDSIEIRIIKDQSFSTVNQKLKGVTITTIEPYPIGRASIRPESYEPGVPTRYIIDFYIEHSIKSGGGLMIIIPSQITRNEEISLSVEAEVTDRPLDQQINPYYEDSMRSLMINNIIQGEGDFLPGPDKKITVKLSGLNTPRTNERTDSFEVTSFYKINNFNFFVDGAKEGLSIKSDCSYPCKSCTNDPYECTSCFELKGNQVGLPLLQLGTCVSECNFGRYYDQDRKQCLECDSNCLDCQGTSTNCLSCSGQSDVPYLDVDKCVRRCPPGFIGNFKANMCKECSPTCATCETTLNTCTSCKLDSGLPWLFEEKCLSKCPDKISVPVGDICEPCDHSCEECAGTPSTCTICKDNMKFDKIANTCTAECEEETQIYNPNGEDGQEHCEQCNPTCTKCRGHVNRCTECKDGYHLNFVDEYKDTCQDRCIDDDLEIKQTSVEGICMNCEDPCLTCDGAVDRCVTCLQEPIKYLLHLKRTCVQYCPAKYEPNEEETECVYVGLFCPEGFQVDRSGDGCVPILFECADGYELNEDNSACVPEPGSPIPFPFLIASIFVSFLVLGSYLKEKFFTKVYTCLLAIIGSFEILMYGMMVVYAVIEQEWAICAFAGAGFIFLVLANVAFTIYYQRDVFGKDSVYSKWMYFFPKTRRFIPVAACLINFKCSKILYSGFYGLESSMAKFGRPLEFYRILRMISAFSYIFCYFPIFIADVIIILKVRWGSQILVLAIETFVLQVLMIVLSYLESKRPPAELLSVGSTQYTTINPRQKRKEQKVMSGYQEAQYSEDDDYEEGVPEVDEKQLIRSKEEHQQLEVGLRQQAFTKIIKAVQSNFVKGVDECALQQVMTKFDQEEIKLRPAFSMGAKDKVSDGSWEAQGDNDFASGSTQWNDDVKRYIRERRYSWPILKETRKGITVDQFEQQVDDIILADQEYLIDNCGKEVKKQQEQQLEKPKKTASRRTQTYLRELLQLDGHEQNDSEQSIIMDDDAEIDDTYAQGLIDNVIQNVSGNEAASDFEEQMNDQSFSKYKEAQKEVPDFDLADIMGEFDQDDLGNFIISRKAGSSDLIDKRGRKVNRRGYLVDKHGNVVNQKGNVIFKKMELDYDDEIPAPFEQCDQLIKNKQDKQMFQIVNEEAPVVEETQQHSLFNVQPNQDVQSATQDEQQDDNYDDDEPIDIQSMSNVEQMIDEITKEKRPRKKKFLKQRKTPTHHLVDNHPPRRYGSNNNQGLYPMIGIENEEQRRLAMIADQISSVTQKLAMENGRYNLGMEGSQIDHNDMASNQDRFNQIKQQTLNEIMQQQHSQQADSHRHLLQQRPNSTHDQVSRKQARPQTGHTGSASGASRPRRNADHNSQKPPQPNNLQKIYQNIDQLVGLEEQQMQTLFQESRNNIGDSRTIDRTGTKMHERRMGGLENIYMSKSQQKQASGVRVTSAARPFRNTLKQYEDDPNELVIDTNMEAVRFGSNAAKDVHYIMQDKVDKLQKGYLQQSGNLSAKHTNLLRNNGAQMMRSYDVDHLSEYRVPHAPASPSSKNPHTVVRHDNWLQ